MSLLEDWPYILIQLGVFVFFVFLCRSAWDHRGRQRHRWLSTLLWGVVFGFTIEALIVAGKHPSYSYATDKFLSLFDVPIWVGLGWGMVAYGAIWTSDHLTFGLVEHARARSMRTQPAPPRANGPRWLLFVLRPICAGFLAVSVDILLDPVAHLVGFWTWKCDCDMVGPWPCPVPCPPDPPGQAHLLRFYDVPFDNFVGWFAITLTYAASSYAVAAGSLSLRRKALSALRRARRSGASSGPFGARIAVVLTEVWVSFLITPPLVALLFLVLYREVFGRVAEWVYAASISEGQMQLFIIIFGLAGILTAAHAVQTPRTGPIKKGVFFVPLFFQGVPLIILVFRAFDRLPNLLASAPSYLLMGLLLFWWPFLDTVIARLAGFIRSLTWRSRAVVALAFAGLFAWLVLNHQQTSPSPSTRAGMQALAP